MVETPKQRLRIAIVSKLQTSSISLALLALTACFPEPQLQEKLIGSWAGGNANYHWCSSYFPDGQFSLRSIKKQSQSDNNHEAVYLLKGSWAVLKGNRFELNLSLSNTSNEGPAAFGSSSSLRRYMVISVTEKELHYKYDDSKRPPFTAYRVNNCEGDWIPAGHSQRSQSFR